MHLGASGAELSFSTPWASLFALGDFKRGPYLLQASSWKSFIPGISTSSCHQLGVWTQHPIHSIHFFILFCWGLLQEITPLASYFCMVAGSCRKCSMSGPSFGEGPRLRLAEGFPAAWSSSAIDSGFRKVTCQCEASWTICRGPWLGCLPLAGALQGPLALP